MIVADSSVVLKWFLPDEELAAEAARLVEQGVSIATPDLLVPEVCNAVLCKRIDG